MAMAIEGAHRGGRVGGGALAGSNAVAGAHRRRAQHGAGAMVQVPSENIRYYLHIFIRNIAYSFVLRSR